MHRSTQCGEDKKFAEGNCSHDEALKVIQWFKEPGYRIKLYQALTKLWYKKNETKDKLRETVDLDSTLDRVHHRINIYREQEESGLQKKNRFNMIVELTTFQHYIIIILMKKY